MTQRSRRTEAQWRELIARFESCGLTQRQFCEENGIGLSTLDKWRRRLNEPQSPVREPHGLIRVSSAAQMSAEVVLQTEWGVTLRCPVSMGVDAIVALSRAISREG